MDFVPIIHVAVGAAEEEEGRAVDEGFLEFLVGLGLYADLVEKVRATRASR